MTLLSETKAEVSELMSLLNDIEISAEQGDNYGDIIRDVSIAKRVLTEIEAKNTVSSPS